jgi:hypothetical protein
LAAFSAVIAKKSGIWGDGDTDYLIAYFNRPKKTKFWLKIRGRFGIFKGVWGSAPLETGPTLNQRTAMLTLPT